MMCVRVCVLYMCKNRLVAFRARHAAADSLPWLFWKKKERILPSVIPVYFCHLFQTTNIDQQLLFMSKEVLGISFAVPAMSIV